MKNIFSLSCKKAAQLYSESQERNLKVAELMALLVHRFVCGPCQRFWNQVFFIENVTRQYVQDFGSNDFLHDAALSPQASDRIKKSLEGSNFS